MLGPSLKWDAVSKTRLAAKTHGNAISQSIAMVCPTLPRQTSTHHASVSTALPAFGFALAQRASRIVWRCWSNPSAIAAAPTPRNARRRIRRRPQRRAQSRNHARVQTGQFFSRY
jgi:hypothetical protein